MGGMVAKEEGSHKCLESKINDAIRSRGGGDGSSSSSIKSLDSIILKFPKIDRSLRKCKATFQQFDEDGNGVIDQHELRRCFRDLLHVNVSDDEIDELFLTCDVNQDMRMNFSEFIVLLCLVHLLHQHKSPRLGMPNLEATFETLVEAFVFLDKNKDGYVSKSEMVDAINETSSGERSSGRIAMKRFEEMDWDKNGMVNFKEFLFAFTHWVGIEDDEEGASNNINA